MAKRVEKIACPRCGETEGVQYVQIHVCKTTHGNVRLVSEEGDYTCVTVGPEILSREGLDMMEDRMECSCGNRWETPDGDDFVFEDDTALLLADKLREHNDWSDDMEDDIVHLLDNVIHDIASNIGSNTNNTGLDGQLDFVVRNLGFEQAVKEVNELLDSMQRAPIAL